MVLQTIGTTSIYWSVNYVTEKLQLSSVVHFAYHQHDIQYSTGHFYDAIIHNSSVSSLQVGSAS